MSSIKITLRLLFGTDDFYCGRSSGINVSLVIKRYRFYDSGVAMLGADGWPIEAAPSVFHVHRFWLVIIFTNTEELKSGICKT